MITLKELRWSNAFSYANNNSIDLHGYPITQIIGINGTGKSSIPLLIQEVTYGKNVKGTKKTSISNRHTDIAGYHIELDFDKNEDQYSIVLDRKTGINLKLLKNGKDISSHTSVNTYKTIASILGIQDFKTFAQLIYQSSTSSLEFLTATDMNRKRFLISLLRLDVYVELHEVFKSALKELSTEITKLHTIVNTLEDWIIKYSTVDLNKQELEDIPKLEEGLLDQLSDLKSQLSHIKENNRKIAANNEYKRLLQQLDISWLTKELELFDPTELKDLRAEINRLEGSTQAPASMITKMQNLTDPTCPTCEQSIDEEHKEQLVAIHERIIRDTEDKIEDIEPRILDLMVLKKQHTQQAAVKEEFVKLKNSIDEELLENVLDKGDLEIKITNLTNTMTKLSLEIERISARNNAASEHNSKVDIISEQLEDYNDQLTTTLAKLETTQKEASILDLLKGTFSTNGLVSYKIESSVKELESKINFYLSELIDLRIFFKLSGDKLNIEVLDGKGLNTAM